MNIKSIRDGKVYFQAILPDRNPGIWDYACHLGDLLGLVKSKQLTHSLTTIVIWEDDF